jgi:hypothetical protein
MKWANGFEIENDDMIMNENNDGFDELIIILNLTKFSNFDFLFQCLNNYYIWFVFIDYIIY